LNEDEILSVGDKTSKEIALTLFKEALKASDPYEGVRNALRLERDKLVVQDLKLQLGAGRKIYVIAFGKAACSMTKAVEDVLGDLISGGVAVTKYGYALPLRRVRVIEAGHPVPDENSLRGALQILRLAERVREEDIVLVLISGGGSALITLPEEGISLNDKIRTNELLLRSGATIYEVNSVRKHISKVKGGKLAKMLKGTVISLILSDVVGDPLEAIASGPTVRDPTTFRDAKKVLENYGLWGKIPESVRRHIELGIRGLRAETLKEDLPNVHNYVIGSVSIAVEAAAKKAEGLGLHTYVLTTTLESEASPAGLVIGSVIQEIYRSGRPFPKQSVILAGGEMTVTIGSSKGLGGPNQEFALSISRKIEGLKGVAVLAADTDGTDGPTNAAGGVVDSYTASILKSLSLDIEEYLKKHNSYEALRKSKALLITGPTRTNVNSIIIAVILD